MNFSWWFSKKIAFGKSKKNKLSSFIILIGQFAVALGMIVSLVTISTGVGARKAIKEKLANFNGHITVTPLNNNVSFNSDSISKNQPFYPKFRAVEDVVHVQAIANKSGIIQTKENFEGSVLKGVGADFDRDRFKDFIIKGTVPKYNNQTYSPETIISSKMAKDLLLDIDSTYRMVFIANASNKPIYRRFTVSGIYQTDIQFFDHIYVIGDIKHVQKLNRWDSTKVGGFELFVDDIENLEALQDSVNNNIPFHLQAQSATTSFEQIKNWLDIFDTNIIVILSLMLVVVIINMIMVLLILIVERTPSVGLLKTFGASNFAIQQIFVYYALWIMVPGLAVGNLLALGFLLLQKYTKFLQLPSPENYFLSTVPVDLNWGFILVLNLSALLICGVILLIPSFVISKVQPAKAIRFR